MLAAPSGGNETPEDVKLTGVGFKRAQSYVQDTQFDIKHPPKS